MAQVGYKQRASLHFWSSVTHTTQTTSDKTFETRGLSLSSTLFCGSDKPLPRLSMSIPWTRRYWSRIHPNFLHLESSSYWRTWSYIRARAWLLSQQFQIGRNWSQSKVPSSPTVTHLGSRSLSYKRNFLSLGLMFSGQNPLESIDFVFFGICLICLRKLAAKLKKDLSSQKINF